MLTRKQKRALLAIAIGAAVIEENTPREREPNKHRNRRQALKNIDLLTERQFKRRFRMSKDRFSVLLDAIREDIRVDEHMAEISSGDPVFEYLQLAICIRYLAGGSYLDIADAHAVHETTVMPIVWKVIEAINKRVQNISFPFSNLEKLHEHAKTFFSVSTELPGTVAAGDGIALNIQAPTIDAVHGDVRSQFSRKGFYTYSVVAFCDAALRIMAVTAEQCGSTGDGMQHSCSWLHELLTTRLPSQFHVVLDEAFKCTTQELSPYAKPRVGKLSEAQDAFNFHLSLHRQVIERCFALLTWRWGVFWRPIRVQFGSIKDLVACCCRLHNWCQEDAEYKRILAASRHDAAFDAALFESLQEHDPEDIVWNRVNASLQPAEVLFNPRSDGMVFVRGDMVPGFRSDLVQGKRAAFTESMQVRGIKRPRHSAEAARKRSRIGQ